MKVRRDFVTNSSSSSFILGFNNEQEIENIRSELPDYWSENTIISIIDDIKNGILSKDKVLLFIDENTSCCDYRFNGKDYWSLSWEEICSEEYSKFEKSIKSKLLEEYNSKLLQCEIFSIVEYEDDSSLGRQLEHEVMPYLNSTIKRFSHH